MKEYRWKLFVKILLSITGFIFIVTASYPGFMSIDSLDQYAQAKTGIYSNWHPPLMAWIWNKLLLIIDGPQPMLLLNNLFYWGAALIISLKIRNTPLSIIFLISCFAPPLINFLGVIWKDTMLMSMLFFQTSLLLVFYDMNKWTINKILIVCLILIISFVCIMLRHNALFAIIPFISLIFCFFYKKLKHFYAFVFGSFVTIGFFLAGGFVSKKLCLGKSLHPEQQLMVYDLMGLSSSLKKNLFPDYLNKKITLDTLPKIYSPCDGALFAIFHMQCATTKESQFDSLNIIWKKEVVLHPSIIFSHKLRAFRCLFFESSLTTFPNIHPNEYGFALSNHNIVRDKYVQYIESKWAVALYKAWFYLIGCFLVFILSLFTFSKGNNSKALLAIYISLSGLLYGCSYFLLSPCNDLRYNYWTIGAFFLSAILFLDSIFTKKSIVQ